MLINKISLFSLSTPTLVGTISRKVTEKQENPHDPNLVVLNGLSSLSGLSGEENDETQTIETMTESISDLISQLPTNTLQIPYLDALSTVQSSGSIADKITNLESLLATVQQAVILVKQASEKKQDISAEALPEPNFIKPSQDACKVLGFPLHDNLVSLPQNNVTSILQGSLPTGSGNQLHLKA